MPSASQTIALKSGSVPTAILGPTGYTGLELIEIIARHPGMHVAYLASARVPAPRIDHEFPRLRGRLSAAAAECRAIDHDAIAAACRLAFLCLPHEAAMEHTPPLLSRGVKVVDLSAAYRLRDAAVYERAYGHPHTDPANLERAVYGLTELARDRVRNAELVANPGCYPTAAALALVPLLRARLVRTDSIIVNAASGVSGAGRSPKQNLHYPEANENFSAYGIGVHRHQPEIAQSLTMWGVGPASTGSERASPAAPDPLFVPHLLPLERGILETIYAAPVNSETTTEQLRAALRAAYEREPFIVVRDEAPTLRDVQRTNCVHLNARVVGGHAVVVAAEDNLVKGASGQAVQNANLMLGLPETAGLL
ncbi:MAG: N-acetyl-gamma-glutamyl-phosphate reductase [Phycisphaerales bacterium]|nr:N-acetyl-gamma-glutamyl-phosphate reductase [Phycisphaerales bacterium]